MKSRDKYDRIAPLYNTFDIAEALYKSRVRPRLFAGLSGTILDAGIGTGSNMPFYPPGARVIGIDYSVGMLSHAQTRVRRMGRDVPLVAMNVLQLGFPARTFDAVVSAFVFCIFDETMQRPALAELRRVCKPGGEIRILDYRLSDHPLLRAAMQGLWAPFQKAVYGCTFSRGTERYIKAAGLELISDENVVTDLVRLLVARPARGT